jgi:hypothetical protein
MKNFICKPCFFFFCRLESCNNSNQKTTSEVDKKDKTLTLEVWDWDLIGSNDAMGGDVVQLSGLPDGTEIEKTLTLKPLAGESVSGAITLRLVDDILFSLVCNNARLLLLVCVCVSLTSVLQIMFYFCGESRGQQ